MSQDSIRSDASAVRRLYDRDTIDAILDAQAFCHIGFVWQGRPQVIPTLYGRDGDRVLFHGSALSRMLDAAQEAPGICLCVSVLDALVLARSAFHHSANYRSVVLYGRPYAIEAEAEKNEALFKISEHLLPGRWAECRAPNAQELKATTVLALDIAEGAAKVRGHGAKDDPRDMDGDYWAGLLPISLVAGDPVPNADLRAGIPLPPSLGQSGASTWLR
jgi:nitroimidazol reductase NimA-like FMN-containing flavoprotein (pyridoxamine 5'-phosphate oxidase superfamily)